MDFQHIPVLLQPAVDSLNIRPDGIYVDGTAGGGGHSEAIAKKLTTGRLISIDRDPDALKAAGERLKPYSTVTVVEGNFCDIDAILASLSIEKVDGVLLDIGVSSHQIDTPQRGFSFHNDAPLDMRMSQSGTTAADLVNSLPDHELIRIFREYGEERFAPAIAAGIVKEREVSPITTTGRLAQIVSANVPAKAKRQGHPARQCFQALRIAVNGELDALDQGLDRSFRCLRAGGRFSVITFHSLEDRMVKRRFADFCTGCTCPPEFPVCVCGKTPAAHYPFKNPVAPTQEELNVNPRAHSAKLRTVEKIKEDE